MELHHLQEEGSKDREKVEMYLSCRDLVNMDIGSLSDPYLVVSMRSPSGAWVPIGQTEIKWNHLNPDFAKSFELDFIFERRQTIRVECRDADDESGKNYDVLGTTEFDLGTAVGSVNSTMILNLQEKGKNMGKLVVRIESRAKSNELFVFKLRGSDLGTSSFCFHDKPFLAISKQMRSASSTNHHSEERARLLTELGNEWVLVYESEHLTHGNGQFKEIAISSSKLCGGDLDLPIRVRLYAVVMCNDHKLRGEFITTPRELMASPTNKAYRFVTPSGDQKGSISVDSAKKDVIYSMLDYIRGGVQMNLQVAIDFTGSNGDPKNPSSLHYISSNLNQYQQAIISIGSILLNYDQDKMVPTYGFGATIRFPNAKNKGQTSHFFPCSGDFATTSGYSIEGVFELYTHCLRNVELSGPTYFAPLLKEVVESTRAGYKQNPNNYNILLILTDGEIHDMAKTVDLIVEGSSLPLSVIIIGIGSANFGLMETLDSDNKLLQGSTQTAKRDIVQFVPLREHMNSPEELAATVLQELPNQVVEFYRMIGLKPATPKESPHHKQGGFDLKNTNYPSPPRE